ncbi:nucleotide sugar dehydrogenase [Pelagibacterales bacterium SAG-MED38]|nr:nucleotide sugar dehydrogenase [Pelagibacterales bacterium SAG-MED38]
MKINTKDIVVGVIGLGYVGLPRALQFCNKKIKVFAFDKDINKLNSLKQKKKYLSNINSKDIKKNIENKRLIPTSDFSKISEVDAIFLCLPTPLKNYKPDLSYIKNTFNDIKRYLKKNQLLCLESTSYPGTTKEIFSNYLNKKFSIGENFYLGYSPERNDPSQSFVESNKIPKLISGFSNNCLKVVDFYYSTIFNKTIKMDTIELAEMTKLYENIYRSINIGFVNEMKQICYKMNLDIDEIIKGAKTKPFGFKAFYPGPGLGGHCIPIDPFYLTWKAKQFDLKTEFINLSGKVNNSIPKWVVSVMFKNLREIKRKSKTIKILVLGIAYKKNINDTRESPGLKIIDILKKRKVKVSYSDPFIPKIPKLRNYNFETMKSITLSKKNLTKFDACILVTDHDKFDYENILKYSKIIIDTRHRLNKKFNNVIYA